MINPLMNGSSAGFRVLALLMLASISCKAVAQDKAYNPFRYSIQKNVIGDRGAVVTAHTLASEVGLEILKQGGNAIDAAIATQFALAVVYPGAGNIGGGGFLVAQLANGKSLTLDFREKAPGRAGRDMYLDQQGNAITGLSREGHLASGVPGTVAGMFEAHRYARLPMAQLIQPAIDLARYGFVISAAEARGLNSLQQAFKKYNSQPPVFLKQGGFTAGDTLIQENLAQTLTRIQNKGSRGFYAGRTARLIVQEMKRGKGIISKKDLKNYEAKWREPVMFRYKDYTILTMPLPSSGGVLLPQMMKMIENRPLNTMGFHSPAAVQLMTEVERRSYADRAKYLGDRDFFKVPVKTLTSEAYLQERMKDYDASKAGSSERVNAGIIPESEETTHFSIYDAEGNAVAVTTTLNDGYGCKTVVGGAGFLLNNEMDDFSVKPGVANMYGALGAEANAIAPGKRMLSSMTPTIVLKQNKPYLIVGTPGGTTITTSVFQTLVNILEFGMNADDAVNKPKFHHQWFPDVIAIEKGFSPETRNALEKMGYKIIERGQIGRTEVIRILENGKIEAVADKRGEDHAAGY